MVDGGRLSRSACCCGSEGKYYWRYLSTLGPVFVHRKRTTSHDCAFQAHYSCTPNDETPVIGYIEKFEFKILTHYMVKRLKESLNPIE